VYLSIPIASISAAAWPAVRPAAVPVGAAADNETSSQGRKP